MAKIRYTYYVRYSQTVQGVGRFVGFALTQTLDGTFTAVHSRHVFAGWGLAGANSSLIRTVPNNFVPALPYTGLYFTHVTWLG